MIYARYSEKPGEIEIEADQTGVCIFSKFLTEGQGSIETSIPPLSAAPYDGYLDRIHIETDEGLVLISRQDRMVKIQGSSESLSVLAQSLDSLMKGSLDGSPGPVPYHVHIEHYPGHPYIDGDSIPLILVDIYRSDAL